MNQEWPEKSRVVPDGQVHRAIRIAGVVGSVAVWLSLGLMFGVWHPGWIALLLGASASWLYYWKRQPRDLIAAGVSILGMFLALFFVASLLSGLIAILAATISAFVLIPALSEKIMQRFA